MAARLPHSSSGDRQGASHGPVTPAPVPQWRLWSTIAARFPVVSGTSGRYLLGLVALCLVVRLILAAWVYGSDDVSNWYRAMEAMIRWRNPYRTSLLNWPPLWPCLMWVSGMVTLAYHLPYHFAVKLFPILADTAITVVLYNRFRCGSDPESAARRTLWYVLNPISVYVSALHGQFDTVPALFALLAVLCAAQPARPGGWGGTAIRLGLGGLAKTWPLVLTPCFLPEIRTWPRRVAFAAAAAAPAVISVGLLYLADPEPIARYVLAYRGYSGWWGVTSLLAVTPRAVEPVVVISVSLLFYTALAAAYVRSWRSPDVAQRALLVLLTFYVFTPGFGLQYLVWIVPIALLADLRNAVRYSLLAGVVIAVITLLRPYTGQYGLFYVSPTYRTAVFDAAYGKTHDQLITCMLELPLWGYCCWWWLRTWKDALLGKSR